MGVSKRAVEDEGRRREEEVALLRRQIEPDTQEREAKRRANVFVTWSGQASGSSHSIEYTVNVSNTGPSAATHVGLYLATPEGHVQGAGTSITAALMPGDQTEATMLAPPRDMYDGILAVHIRWADEANPDNDEDSGVRLSPP